MRKHRLLFCALTLVLLLVSVSCAQQVAPQALPRNAIIMVPDGMGPSTVALARLINDKPLALDAHLVGTGITCSEDHIVTDSAAAATALATSVRTNNNYVGMTANRQWVANVLEAAKWQRQMATGLVVTTRLTHATPAAFSAHVRHRDEEETIAAQQFDLRVDVMMGGGRKFFLPQNARGSRKDNRDLLAEARQAGYQVITTRSEFDSTLRMPLMAMFAMDYLRYDIDRIPASEPSLEEMTRRALQLLSTHPQGFIMMIEGSRIDNAAHVHDGAAALRDVLAFDAAFAAAVDFARRDGHTLVVVQADHDTGGMGIKGGQWNPRRPGPLQLGNVKTAAESMVDMITGGQTLQAVLAEYAAIQNVTTAESEAYAAATPGRADEVRKRRILALAKIISDRNNIGWTTTDHTAVDVGVYAFGPGYDRFRGAQPSSRIATTVAELLKLDLQAATSELRRRQADSTPVTSSSAAQ